MASGPIMTLLAALLAALALVGAWSSPVGDASPLASASATVPGVPPAQRPAARLVPGTSVVAPDGIAAARARGDRPQLTPGRAGHDGGARPLDLAVPAGLALTAALLRRGGGLSSRRGPRELRPATTAARAPPPLTA
jgi:hypothetical protein